MNIHNACVNMIKQQLRTNDILNESILALYESIPRHDFVPEEFKDFAYSDMQIPLPYDQKMLTPLEESIMLQALALQGNETVLEIGTGSGFFTALLSRLCKHLISVDYYQEFTSHAKSKLKKHNCHNVELITGDASRGWLEKAPYDVIVFTGAIESLSETHKLQLLPGGTFIVIEGRAPLMKANCYQLDHNESWTKTLLFETNTPHLIDPLKAKEFVF